MLSPLVVLAIAAVLIGGFIWSCNQDRHPGFWN